MKEITRISLAQLPYNIEIAAKKELEKYLVAVEHSLGADADAMKEIEGRIAELLADRGVSGEKVITGVDIAEIKQHLGDPKEFADEDAVHELGHEAVSATSERSLMRDTNDQVIGGVCSGLAAYAHVDTVWVRLGMAFLTIMTGGATILIYLILWIIMPPARTAAERLQMKGMPVTLEAIQEESAVKTKKGDRRNTVLFALRVLLGGGCLILAAGIFMGLIGFAWHLVVEANLPVMTNLERLYWGCLFSAGIVFVVFCVAVARALFTNRYTKYFWIGISTLVVLGLSLLVTGVLSYGLLQRTMNDEMSKMVVHRSIDASQIKQAKRLMVHSELPITVNYNVDPASTEATVWYNSAITNYDPQVVLATSSDGTLTVNVPEAGSKCLPDVSRCRAQTTVTIVGPELESVSAVGSNLVHYTVDTQDTLVVTTRADGRAELQSTGLINQVRATMSNESRIDTNQAGIKNLSLTVEDALSNADIATVDSLSIIVPAACAANHGGGTVNVQRATSVMVNGASYDAERDYACARIKIASF